MTLADLTVDQLRDEFIGCGWKTTKYSHMFTKGAYELTILDNRLISLRKYGIHCGGYNLSFYKTIKAIEESLDVNSFNDNSYKKVYPGLSGYEKPKERNVIKTLLLFIMTVSLCVPFFAISFLYTIVTRIFKFKTLATYFYNSSFSFDQTGNTVCCYLFNDFLIKPEGFRMGNFDETISHVLGQNIRRNTLYPLGKFIAGTVDFFAYMFGDGKNHCLRASYISQNNIKQE